VARALVGELAVVDQHPAVDRSPSSPSSPSARRTKRFAVVADRPRGGHVALLAGPVDDLAVADHHVVQASPPDLGV
jgi:hypothetical protein